MSGRRDDDARWADRERSRSSDWEARQAGPDAEDGWRPRGFDSERYFHAAARERDGRDFQRDLDYGRAARALDHAREYGRDFDLDRELDRRARELDPERIARRPGYSPSGTFREVGEGGLGDDRPAGGHRGGPGHGRHGRREEAGGPDAPARRPRGGPPEVQGADASRGHHPGRDERVLDRGRPWRGAGRMAETDVRYGGTQPAGHGPGVENMAPPWDGYSTSRTRPEDHEAGHGGFTAGGLQRRGERRRGKAPRGYQRSSERILADLCDGLLRSWVDAEDVDIRVRDGVVLLSGVVRSADERQATEALAHEVLGVKEVINDIRVHRDEGIMAPPASRRPVQGFREDGDDDTLHS